MEDLDFSGLLANCSPLKILKLQKNLLQIAVDNYFIVQTYVSNDRTDYDTLIPVLEKHKNAFGEILEEVTADSGYCNGCIYKAKCLYKINVMLKKMQRKIRS